jgi:nucleotide-binding universal stress UspA family protein
MGIIVPQLPAGGCPDGCCIARISRRWPSTHFAEALRWAKTDRAELLLHVVNPTPSIIGDEYVSSPWLSAEINRAFREGAMETLGRLLTRAKEYGVRGEALELQGLPAYQIVHAAESRDVDLIVMGTHGRMGLLRLLLGSLVEEVVAKAPCPVLLVGPSVFQREPATRPALAPATVSRRDAGRRPDWFQSSGRSLYRGQRAGEVC